jgi:PAS domain S-box-containing protein
MTGSDSPSCRSEHAGRALPAHDLHWTAGACRALIDSIADGVIAIDAGGRITIANPAFARMHGLRTEDLVGRLISDFPAPPTSARHLDGRLLTREEYPVVRALGGEVIRDFEKVFFNERTGRDVRLRVNASPIRSEDGEILGAAEVIRDVTDMMELEMAKEQFIRVAAHELNTPVAVIKGYAQEILRTTDDLPQHKKRMIAAIGRATDRLARLFRDVIDISQLQLRRGSLAAERVELSGVVERIAGDAAPGSGRHRVRVTRLDPAVVRGDPARLEQVLRTLVDNAIRYSPDGGDVEIDCVDQGEIAIVTVTDHGIGIPKDRQSRIFERFYRAHTDTSHDYGGMGVGLCVARLLAQQMGGDMWFESEVDEGSRFHVRLATWGGDGAASQ